jgi:predicted amidohydrolase YtcJ
MISHRLYLFALAGAFFLSACDADRDQPVVESEVAQAPADLLLLNAYVYTVDDGRSIAEAVAVNDGEIVLVGTNDEVQELRGPESRVLDLQGRMVLPGLHDVHVHIFGIVEPDACSLNSQVLNLTEIVSVVQECLAHYRPAEGEWLTVDMWNFAEGNQASEDMPHMRAALDSVSTEHPIMLWGNDGHHGAANSRALELAMDKEGRKVGLSAASLAGVFSEYTDLVGVDSRGEPNGELNEQARGLLGLGDGSGSAEHLGPLLPQIGGILASHGLTSVQAPSLTPDYFPWLQSFENSGQMKFRLKVATRLDPLDWAHPETGQVLVDDMMDVLQAARQKFRASELISATAAKIYVDGVIEGNPLADPPTLPNAAVLAAYRQPRINYDLATQSVSIDGYVDTGSEACQEIQADPQRFSSAVARDEFMARNGFHPAQCTVSHGVLRDQEAFVHDYVRRLDEAGFSIHIHVIGDRAARVAVDALEGVMVPAENNPLRHTLTHLQLVHPEEQKRIGALGLYLAFTYAWAVVDPVYDMTVIPFIEEIRSLEDTYRADSYYMQNVYPARSMMETGGVLVGGSDAPVDDRSPRPFVNMAAGITRGNPQTGVLNENETIDVHQMIAAYTINGARAMAQENSVGSIESGKRADLVVLDQNIVELYESGEAERIVDTRVDFTIFDGEIIYTRR